MKIQPFEEYADQYEGWFEKNYWVYQSELQAVKGLLPQQGNGLEVGVGSGRFAGPLGISFGVEPSPKMRMLAKARGIKVIDASGEYLPFNDFQFDFVLMVTMICFFDDINKAFRETYRILKPNSHLVIGFIDKNSPVGEIYQKHKNENEFYKLATFYSIDEVVFYLKNAGFKKFEFNQTIFKDLRKIKDIEPIKNGYGKGSFVVISALKE
ncbi:MAG TPA: class I SAM-dependent methyltransferase [Candidatus Omnitrophota bacterium]|nr:class I SAM-dependent methyltransferase [Candidatus Omnitrophota bacterium]HPN56365.1 class I SAM-dependent methyltransferase [Candidatus Omnitrophota bacterium]